MSEKKLPWKYVLDVITKLFTLFKEKDGKISFKRSFAILILTLIVVPDVSANGITWLNMLALGIGAGAYVIPKLFSKSSE